MHVEGLENKSSPGPPPAIDPLGRALERLAASTPDQLIAGWLRRLATSAERSEAADRATADAAAGAGQGGPAS